MQEHYRIIAIILASVVSERCSDATVLSIK